MGIFDPVNGANGNRPVGLVSRYQSAMQRAAYSPTVAQAAARSGVNPTLATRVAAREVAQQSNQALPGLIAQEAQMMEARRLENERKEREMAGMGLNIAGQVVGTALSAYGGGGGGQSSGGSGQGGGSGAVGGVMGVGSGLLSSYENQAQNNANLNRSRPAVPAQMAQQQILQAPSQQPSATAVEAAPPQASVQPAGYMGAAGVETPEQYQNRVRQNYATTALNESMAGRSIAPLPSQFVAPPNQAQSRRRPRSRS